jgi:hypothetical protein
MTIRQLLVVIACFSLPLAGVVNAQTLDSNSQAQELAIKVSNEVAVLNAAALMYYKNNDSWPSSLEALAGESGYVTGALMSSVGTSFTGAPSGSNFAVSFSVDNVLIGKLITQQLANTSFTGSVITAQFKPPYASAAYDDYLQRKANPDDPSKMTLETGLSFNDENSLNDVSRATGQSIETINIDGKELALKQLKVSDNARLGSVTFSEGSDGLVIGASEVRFSGKVGTAGDIDLTNDDIKNIAALYAERVTSSTADITDAEVQKVVGDYANFTTGQLDSASGQTIDFVRANINRVTGDNATAMSAVGDELNVEQAFMQSLLSEELIARAMSSQSTNTVTLSVTGLAEITEAIVDYVSADTTEVERLLTEALSSTEVNATTTSGVRMVASGLTYLEEVTANYFESDDFTVVNGQSNGGEVETLTVNQLNSLSGVFRRLLTGVLEAKRSILGTASAGELAVQQLLQANEIDAATGSFGRTELGGDLRGNRATFNRAVGGRFDGQRFEGDDFHISGSSENEIFHRINSLDGKLYNCKYVTEYCFPKAPLIDQTSCPECRLQQESSNFSAEASALVKRCQHGCDYKWQLGDVSGSCSSGSIGEGGQRKISCPVSASLDAGEHRRTFIDLVAVNANDTTKRTSHRFAVDWDREEQQNTLEDIASFKVEQERYGSVGEEYVSETLIPTIEGKSYGDWSQTECSQCTWSYSVLDIWGEGRGYSPYEVTDRGVLTEYDDSIHFSVRGERCENVDGGAEILLQITNPETSESITWTIRLNGKADEYHPHDCGG